MKILMMFVLSFSVLAQTKGPKVKYKKSERIDFESLLIEGEKLKGKISVITGNVGKDDFGILKLRENFLDMMADDIGKEIK